MKDYRLFYDDEFEALRQVIESGEGYKKSSLHLWPSMKPESAYARLKACVNARGDQHLRFGEVVELMRFNGRFDALYHACDECSHDRPARRAPADRQAELVREFIAASERLGRMHEQITSGGGIAALQSVKP